MILLAIDPFTKTEMGKFTVDTKNLYQIYEILIMALDHNPSTAKFAELMQPIQKFVDDPVLFSAWIIELQKIKTEVERPDAMCFTFEDYIDEWFIVDFIDQRFLVLRLIYDLTSTTTSAHLDATGCKPVESIDHIGNGELYNTF